jgi:AraC family transcriptional regulator
MNPDAMRPPAVTASRHAGEDVLVDAATGTPFPAAPTGSLLGTSLPLGWRGVIVERHRLPPRELSEHYVIGHGISVNTGAHPIPFGWNGRGGWRDSVINPGESHFLTQGELNTPRWLQTLDEISIVLQPSFVADIVRDGLPADRIEFASQRSVDDSIIARYARALHAELAADVPKGSLYAETLTVGLVLHLLANYGVAKPKAPAPRGKLNAFQLRNVVDFVDAHLSEDVSLIVLARQAHVSPFHFARLFRRTLGIPPHQFVLQLRVQRALRLMKTRTLSLAQVAVESGFHDQAHFTKAFRKVLGTTPAAHPLTAHAD